MSTLEITGIPTLFEGPLYEDRSPSEDPEPRITFSIFVSVLGSDGVEYAHPQGFRRNNTYQAEVLAQRVARAGRITKDRWVPTRELLSLDACDHVVSDLGMTIGCTSCGTTLDRGDYR